MAELKCSLPRHTPRLALCVATLARCVRCCSLFSATSSKNAAFLPLRGFFLPGPDWPGLVERRKGLGPCVFL